MLIAVDKLVDFKSSAVQHGRLERALEYRAAIYPVLEQLLDPQNKSIEAQALQRDFERLASPQLKSAAELYSAKRAKAQLLSAYIDKLMHNPAKYGLSFMQPPSQQDKLWARTLLVYDFIYYGPVTMLAIVKILAAEEDLRLNPMAQLMQDIAASYQVNEIRVNKATDVFFESGSKIFTWPVPFLSDGQLQLIIERMISESNLLYNAAISINASQPIADFEHPCGYIRGAAVIAPAAEHPFLTLRLHPELPYTLDQLMGFAMFSEEIRDFLKACQLAGTTIVIAGTMGSGKTTLLSALAEHWPSTGRKATIEDTPELRPNIADLVKMRTIDYDRDELRNIDVARLTKACKRHSVRYVVLSEARDYSAWEILQLSQAILGSLMTFHYTIRGSRHLVDQALNALVALCRQHPLAPDADDLKHQIASMVQILILIEQDPVDAVRRIVKIYQLQGYDELNGGHFKAIELFSYDAKQARFKLENSSKDFEEYLRSKGVNYVFARS